jgi:two-component system sensor histidine kinase BaeS
LFFAVLLAILAVAASGIGLMRERVLGSFSDYAVQIELDRLSELSGELERQYKAGKGWGFIPAQGREDWIKSELARLRDQPVVFARGAETDGPQNSANAAPRPVVFARSAETHGPQNSASAAPRPMDSRAAHENDDGAARLRNQTVVFARSAETHGPQNSANAAPRPMDYRAPPAELPPLPAPPAPPLPPTPPSPASPESPGSTIAPPAAPEPPASPVAPDTDPGQLGLLDRISLVDATGAWLAGRQPGAEPYARRAIVVDGSTAGYLQVAKPLRPNDAMALAFLEQLGDSLVLIVAASVILSALAAVLLASHFRQPIHRLAAGAARLSEGDFATRIEVERSDELGELANAFNRLAGKLAEAESSRRAWVADTSHELRTPIAVLRAQLEAIQDGVRTASPETVASMLRQVLALNKLVDELYTLAQSDVGELALEPAAAQLAPLVQAHALAFEDRMAAAGLALAVDRLPDAQVRIDARRIGQVLDNLLENCVRYTDPGGRVVLHGAIDGGLALIHIDDSKPGVPDGALSRLAERFYRVDASRSRARGGAGLGLALCERIVAAHGGTLAFSHSPLGGLRATLTLPLA